MIVKNFTATILRGDKVGLVGPNGIGKTTLLKLILGELAPDSGKIRTGMNMQIAYFDQMRDALDENATLGEFISPGSDWIEVGGKRTHVMTYLQDFPVPAGARQCAGEDAFRAVNAIACLLARAISPKRRMCWCSTSRRTISTSTRWNC